MKIYASMSDDGFRTYLVKKLEQVQQWQGNYTDRNSYNAGYLEGQEDLLKEIMKRFSGLFDRLEPM